MNNKEAIQIVGGLSSPGKMPCPSYSLPARACNVGSSLRAIPGTVCSNCYACKGNYRFSNVKQSQERRLASLSDPRWTGAMVHLLQGMPHFRWHDSGDLQSRDHLEQIIQIAKTLPDTAFWLPTHETRLIQGVHTPPNLTIRVSAVFIGKPAQTVHPLTSTVGYYGDDAFQCPVGLGTQKTCGTCRACWSPKVKTVNYKEH